MSLDFSKNIFDNCRNYRRPFLAAHRGVSGANIPCNTLASYKIAMDQGAEVVEIDVAISKDGEYFCFHPGTEPVFLKCGKYISDMTAEEVRQLTLLNMDEVPTHYTIPTLKQAFDLMKDKVYINVDKYWTDIEGISREIRKCGVERQVIVKTPAEQKYFDMVEKYAPDLMYMGIAGERDDVSDELLRRNIKYIGIEALFENLSAEIASEDYILKMHNRGLLVWANAIIYNEKAVLAAHLSDDESLRRGDGYGWKELAKMQFDIIQTDWPLAADLALRDCRK